MKTYNLNELINRVEESNKSQQDLTQFTSLILNLINNIVIESINDFDSDICLDIGIGKLFITIEDSVEYYFVPSEELKKSVLDGVNKKNKLVSNLEKRLNLLVTKIISESIP